MGIRVSDRQLREMEYEQHPHYLYGASAQRNGDSRSAFAQYRAEVRRTGYYKAHLMLGNMLLDRRRAREAAAALRAAARGARRVGREDHAAEALTSLGIALEMSNDLAKAKAAWRRAARLDARNCSALLNLGLRLLRDGERRQGATAIEEAFRRKPRDWKNRRWIGCALVRFDLDLARGLRYLEGAARASSPVDPELLADLSVAYEKSGQRAKAHAMMRRARRLRRTTKTSDRDGNLVYVNPNK